MQIKNKTYNGSESIGAISDIINKNPYACYFYHSKNTYDSEVLEQVESIMVIHNSISYGTFIVVNRTTLGEYEQSILKLLCFDQLLSSDSFMMSLRASYLYDQISNINFDLRFNSR